ncbi:MAG: TauD/TfdA family dioxygenase [Kofleriaceae bacterium]|nr:TauD/TfdA family dioxygenase [Kofleriaceae bacterium]
MQSVELRDGYLRVIDAGTAADFHFRWLRHNCDLDRHPKTNERTVDSADLPDVLEVTRASITDGVLRVEWKHDGRVSGYPLGWLREHAYAIDRPMVPPPPSHVPRLELHRGERAIPALVPEVLARVATEGAVVVRRDPRVATPPEDETELWIDALSQGGALEVIGTHFGRIEDLRTDNTTNANTDQLGYTDAPIDLHTDQPFLDHPPRYQLLQSIRAADVGGESTIADASAAFRYLESIDREASALLLATPIRFHRKQKAFERQVVSPLVRKLADGRLFVRASYFTMAPHHVPFDLMENWYRAYDRFMRLVRDPRHHYRFTLSPGDALLYDNHRVLHGRCGFRGARWVRGVYFDNRQ